MLRKECTRPSVTRRSKNALAPTPKRIHVGHAAGRCKRAENRPGHKVIEKLAVIFHVEVPGENVDDLESTGTSIAIDPPNKP